jgi:hypothetical protein
MRTDSAFGRPLDWSGFEPAIGTLSTRVPNIRLGIERNLVVTPPLLGNFVNGVWTGTAAIDVTSTNLVLRAVDDLGRNGQSNPSALIQLRLTRILHSGSDVIIRFPTLNGAHYIVEGSASVYGGWLAISPVLTGNGGLMDFTVTAEQMQFFRVQVVP